MKILYEIKWRRIKTDPSKAQCLCGNNCGEVTAAIVSAQSPIEAIDLWNRSDHAKDAQFVSCIRVLIDFIE